MVLTLKDDVIKLLGLKTAAVSCSVSRDGQLINIRVIDFALSVETVYTRGG